MEPTIVLYDLGANLHATPCCGTTIVAAALPRISRLLWSFDVLGLEQLLCIPTHTQLCKKFQRGLIDLPVIPAMNPLGSAASQNARS